MCPTWFKFENEYCYRIYKHNVSELKYCYTSFRLKTYSAKIKQAIRNLREAGNTAAKALKGDDLLLTYNNNKCNIVNCLSLRQNILL